MENIIDKAVRMIHCEYLEAYDEPMDGDVIDETVALFRDKLEIVSGDKDE